MAMIKCPECGQEISDKAKKCVHCGVRVKKRNTKKFIIIFLIIFVLLITGVGGGLIAYKSHQEKITAEYKTCINETVKLITDSSTDLEQTGTFIHEVWNNAIEQVLNDATDKYTLKNQKPQKGASFEEAWAWLGGDNFNDYNTALQNLFSDEMFVEQIDKIKNQKKKIETNMQKLKDVPKGQEEEYETIKEYYNVYISFVTHITDVNGSLQSWTNTYNETDSNLKSSYEKVKTYITK